MCQVDTHCERESQFWKEREGVCVWDRDSKYAGVCAPLLDEMRHEWTRTIELVKAHRHAYISICLCVEERHNAIVREMR